MTAIGPTDRPDPGNLIAKAAIDVNASRADVWDALVNPVRIKQYMFGTTVTSDWREGGPISWKGEWKGKPYEDKGVILQFNPENRLQYSHYSPLGGKPDAPENYHTVTIGLSDAAGGGTRAALEQDKNETEEARAHSQQMWEGMLAALKKFLEEPPA